MEKQDVHISKALSWLLRHGAVREHLEISDEGFIPLHRILSHKSFKRYSLSDIQRVVEQNSKQRFSLRHNPTNGKLEIKANQGHSFDVVKLDLRPLKVDESTVVVHGTYLKNWDKIREEGLSRMKRTHIHFAAGEPGNEKVISGIRSDCQVLIYINAQKLLEDNIPLFESPNGVILSSGDAAGIILPKYFKEIKFVRGTSAKKHQ